MLLQTDWRRKEGWTLNFINTDFTSEFICGFTSEFINEFTSEFISEFTSEFISEFASEFISEFTSKFISKFVLSRIEYFLASLEYSFMVYSGIWYTFKTWKFFPRDDQVHQRLLCFIKKLNTCRLKAWYDTTYAINVKEIGVVIMYWSSR